MQSTLTVTLVQADCIWEDPIANREHLNLFLKAVTPEVDAVIVPEMFASGFSMEPHKCAETMDGPTVRWMQQWSQNKGFALAGSLAISESGSYYNRFIWALPDGSLHWYDKRHGFSLAGEHKLYVAGTSSAVFEFKGWRICPRICYDLRFPVWSRNTEDYDLLLYVANWPAPRIAAWDILLQARAIENMSYCIGVNRVGSDPNGNQYPGHSAAYAVLGNPITKDLKSKEGMVTAILDRDSLQSIRKQLHFLADRDEFVLGQKSD
ncbi:MAG: amidohydrolase [Flavobacteriaceae bacterium]